MNATHRFAALAVFLLLAACAGRQETSKDSPGPPGTIPARPGLVIIPPDSPKLRAIGVQPVGTAQVPSNEVVSPGRIEANPNRISRVLLPVPGRLSRVLAKLGDSVSVGQPLLEVESPDADADMSAFIEAEGSVAQAKAVLLKAQSDYDRASDLYSHNAIAQKEVVSADSALAQAKAGVEQANAAREQALRRLELLGLKPGAFGQKIAVMAPSAGKILEMNAATGEYRNDTSISLMTIVDLSTVWVSAEVPESYIRFVHLGEGVEISLLAYPGETFHGQVRRIADTINPQTRTVEVLAELGNADGRFRPEMYGSVRHTAALTLMPVVPAAAVIQAGDGAAVFLEEQPGYFQRTAVVVGKRYGDFLPIMSGIKPGDRVVVDGAMLLKTR